MYMDRHDFPTLQQVEKANREQLAVSCSVACLTCPRS
jgi:hypothetical protein